MTRLKRQDNGIMCNERPIRTIDHINDGDIIVLNVEDDSFLEPNGTLNVAIVFENADVVIFDKPSLMPVHPSIKHQGDTLGNYFAFKYPDSTFRAINRLDRDTSGLCAVAKNAHSANVLQGSLEKVYYAVVEGEIKSAGTIDAPIARESDSIIKRCVRSDGQRAVTHYNRLAFKNGYSLVEVHLETGRTHQIRVHFAHIGYPLAGDDMYGGNCELINRQALHCGKLNFCDVMTNEKIIVKSELSPDILSIFGNSLEV